MRDIKDSTTITLSTRINEKLASLRGLQSRLVEIRDYLKSVASGALPVNHQIVYHLQDMLNLLPDLDDPTKTKSFNSNTNDQLLVVYLSSLVRAVIALHALVDNKAANGRAELEEGKESKTDDDKLKKSVKNEAKKEKGKESDPKTSKDKP